MFTYIAHVMKGLSGPVTYDQQKQSSEKLKVKQISAIGL